MSEDGEILADFLFTMGVNWFYKQKISVERYHQLICAQSDPAHCVLKEHHLSILGNKDAIWVDDYEFVIVYGSRPRLMAFGMSPIGYASPITCTTDIMLFSVG